MQLRMNAEKLTPRNRASSAAASLRFFGTRRVIGVASPTARKFLRCEPVAPLSTSSEYFMAFLALKAKCNNNAYILSPHDRQELSGWQWLQPTAGLSIRRVRDLVRISLMSISMKASNRVLVLISPPTISQLTCICIANARDPDRDRRVVEYICRRAVRTRHASAGNCGSDASWQQAGRVARVGKAAGAAGGMHVSRVGLQSGHAPCLRAPPHSPADAGLFVGRRSATAHAPPSGLALAQGWQGRCASSPCAEQPGWRRSALRGGLSRLRPCQPCASAL